MPTLDGKLLNLDVVLNVFGVDVKVVGSVEILSIRKRVA